MNKKKIQKVAELAVEVNPLVLTSCNDILRFLHKKRLSPYDCAAVLAMALGRVIEVESLDREFVTGIIQLSYDMSRASCGAAN